MDKKLYTNSIILIGPSGAGKSTVAKELEQITGMQRLSLDRIANNARKTGFIKNFKNTEEFNCYMISKLLEDAEKSASYGIVDFGAGHSVYEDPKIFDCVKEMLKSFENIVLLLPDQDRKKSLEIMKNRSTGDTNDNERFLLSICNYELATITVYEKDRTSVETATGILQQINKKNKNKKLLIIAKSKIKQKFKIFLLTQKFFLCYNVKRAKKF